MEAQRAVLVDRVGGLLYIGGEFNDRMGVHEGLL